MYVHEIIFFHHPNSQMCGQVHQYITQTKTPAVYFNVHSKKVAESLKRGKQFTVTHVPTLIVTFKNGETKKFEGGDCLRWLEYANGGSGGGGDSHFSRGARESQEHGGAGGRRRKERTRISTKPLDESDYLPPKGSGKGGKQSGKQSGGGKGSGGKSGKGGKKRVASESENSEVLSGSEISIGSGSDDELLSGSERGSEEEMFEEDVERHSKAKTNTHQGRIVAAGKIDVAAIAQQAERERAELEESGKRRRRK